MNHDTIAQDADGMRIEHATGQEVEFVFLALDDNGMSGIAATGDSGTDIIFLHFKKRSEYHTTHIHYTMYI